MTPPPRIIGDFKVGARLGSGGMGVVYRARQLSLVRDVALKVLSAEVALEPARILRFQREAALLGRLSHPNIVQVFMVGEDAGFHYLAMEFIDGSDLERALLAKAEGRGDELPVQLRGDFVKAATEVVRDVARGLGAAHARGIVHRDVKPSNILLGRDGRVCVADFGLARDLQAMALTQSGDTLGTPYYMSPERYDAAEPTPAADVYASGAVLYECLTGRRVFEGDSPHELMARILEDDPVAPRLIDPSIDRDVETIVLKCLSKDPERRYRDGGRLADDLTRYLAGEPIEAAPVGAVSQVLRRMHRRKTSVLLLAVIVAVSLLGFALGYLKLDASSLREARNRIELAINQEDTDGARRLMDELLDRWPGTEAVRFERAELALRERRFEDALADFERLASDDLDPVAAQIGVRLMKSIVDDPTQPPAIDDRTPTTARQAFYRAITFQSRGERDLALAENRRALDLDPDYHEARYSLGMTLFRLQDLDGAEEELLAYSRVRSRAEVDMHLGDILFHKENFEAALVSYQRFVRKRPQSAAGWSKVVAAHVALAADDAQKGLLDAMDEHSENARQALERARELDSSDPMIAFNEAVLAVLDYDIETAQERFQAALEHRVSDDLLLMMCVWFARMLDWAGESDLALEYLEGSAAARPWFRERYYWTYACASTYLNLGREDDARQVLDHALAGPLAGSAHLAALRAQLRAD